MGKFCLRSLGVCAVLATVASTAEATVVRYDPINAGNSVAANVPASGNTWIGLAQSFTAADTNIRFGLYMHASQTLDQTTFQPLPPVGGLQFLYTLYSGNISANVEVSSLNELGSAIVSVPSYGYGTSHLVMADFSSVSLTVGSSYLVKASLLTEALPPEGRYSDTAVMYAGVENYPGTENYPGSNYPENPYSGGQFFYVRPDNRLGFGFEKRDIAFLMLGSGDALDTGPGTDPEDPNDPGTGPGSPGAVPEPSTWAMMIVGFGMAGASLRVRKRTVRALA